MNRNRLYPKNPQVDVHVFIKVGLIYIQLIKVLMLYCLGTCQVQDCKEGNQDEWEQGTD